MYRLTNFPDRLKVGPYWYQFSVEDVVLDDPDKDESDDNHRLYGRCDRVGQVIHLQAAYQCVAQAIDTVIHEVMHAVWWCWHLGEPCSEEAAVTNVATGLTSILIDNPDFDNWLSRATKAARHQ